MMGNNSEIEALIKLLDDPDEMVFNQIKSRLLELGTEVIPSLENAWESLSLSILTQQRIEDLIHEINFNKVKSSLKSWITSSTHNLLEGSIILAQYQYPDLDVEKIHATINQIKQDVWIELNEKLTPLEKTYIFNQILFDVYGFSGNKKDFHAPQNSYINNVLDTKKGNPLSLSIIYVHIAQELNIPIKGVNLPSHFVLGFEDTSQIMKFANPEEDNFGMLFYINPFSRGSIFNKNEISAFLEQINLPSQRSFYTACENEDMIKRVLTNLIYSYDKLGYPDKTKELKELLSLFN